MSTKIVTHGQNFHIDELFAIVFIKIYVDKDIDVIRTRDPKTLEEAKKDPSTWVVDVGFEHNPEMKNFDHHQSQFHKTWPCGTPKSSCGIVWDFLKENNFLSQHMNKETIEAIEKEVIIKVDKQDNGIEMWKEAFFISIFNRQSNDNKVLDKQFHKALRSTEDFFKNMFGVIRQEIKAKKEVEKVIKASEEFEGVVVLKSNNKRLIHELQSTDQKVVVAPYKGKDEFQIRTISNEKMPKNWGGRQGKDLEEVSGFPGMVFCHKGGHLCVVKGTKELAIFIAQHIIKNT